MKAILRFFICIGFLCLMSCNQTEKEMTLNSDTTISNTSLERVEPPNWWVGFKDQKLQLLVKHPKVGEATPTISYQGVSILKTHKADSPNYLFLDLDISEHAKA